MVFSPSQCNTSAQYLPICLLHTLNIDLKFTRGVIEVPGIDPPDYQPLVQCHWVQHVTPSRELHLRHQLPKFQIHCNLAINYNLTNLSTNPSGRSCVVSLHFPVEPPNTFSSPPCSGGAFVMTGGNCEFNIHLMLSFDEVYTGKRPMRPRAMCPPPFPPFTPFTLASPAPPLPLYSQPT
jgi:hypothetical protein